MQARSGLAILALVLACAAPATSHPIAYAHCGTVPALPTTGAARPPLAHSRSLPYRLGNAARPFGWSTAIGDLNADGGPDFAILDRAARKGDDEQYGYRLELSISGLDIHHVAFESDQGSLTVVLSDLDHDDDLDIVVYAAPSHEGVGVWLNDGQGRFASADVQQFPAAFGTRRTLGQSEPSGVPSMGLSPSRTEHGLLDRRATARPELEHPLPVFRRSVLQSSAHALASSPRAPPPHSTDL